jgi:MFS family permease
MLKNYQILFAIKGSVGISFAGLIARLPIAMDSLAILYVCIQNGKSYSLAGTLTGVAALTTVISSPMWAKVADVRRQRFVLRWAVLLRVSALIFFIFCATSNSPIWLWFGTIMVAESASFSIGAFTRRRWAFLLEKKDREVVSTAYALESIIDECVFILGPLMASLIASQLSAEAAIVGGIVFFVLGSQLLALSAYSEPKILSSQREVKRSTLISNRHLQAVAIPLTLAGGYFSATTLVVVAFTKESASNLSSGILLSLWALGGAISLFANSAINWKIGHGNRLLIYTFILTILAISLPFIHNSLILGLSLFLQGACIGPLLPNAIPIIERSVSSQQLTQGISLITAGIPLTGALSSSITGRAIDLFGVEYSLWIPFVFMSISAMSVIPFLNVYLEDYYSQ